MKLVGLLALALGACHVLYEPLGYLFAGDTPAVQRKLYYILRGVEGMTAMLLLVYLGPLKFKGRRLFAWSTVACVGYLEEEQTAMCRLATWDTPVKQLSPAGICSDAFGTQVYFVVLAGALAWVGMKWGRQAWSSKAT